MTRFLAILSCVILLGVTRTQAQTGNDLVSLNHSELLEVIASSDATLTLVNIWATWCSPCVEEFPEIVQLSREYDVDQLRVIFVSLDFENNVAPVHLFLDAQGWEERSYIRSGSDNEFVNGFIPEWTGAVPATFIFNTSNELVWHQERMTSYNDLKDIVAPILD